jgi:hypothetical protein
VDPLEPYLAELSANRYAGSVPETSGYGALATLLNEVGHKLKPKVRCVINPASRGAGIPDGGFFVASQFERGSGEPLPGQLPARGALEVKPAGDDVRVVAESEQVRRYLEKYRQVLEFACKWRFLNGCARLLNLCRWLRRARRAGLPGPTHELLARATVGHVEAPRPCFPSPRCRLESEPAVSRRFGTF